MCFIKNEKKSKEDEIDSCIIPSQEDIDEYETLDAIFDDD